MLGLVLGLGWAVLGQPRVVRVLVFGDSLAYGVLSDGSATDLVALSVQRGVTRDAIEIRTAAVPGETASAALARLPALAARADVVVIWSGANDLSQLDTSSPAVDRVVALAQAARSVGAVPILVAAPPRTNGARRARGQQLVPAFNAGLARQARLLGIRVVRTDGVEVGPDGLHLSVSGYRTVGLYVAGAVAETLAERTWLQPRAPTRIKVDGGRGY